MAAPSAPVSAANPPRREALRSLALVLLCALVGLAAVDYAWGRIDAARDLRGDAPLAFDPVLAWINRPGHRGESTAINALGLRGPELPPGAPPAELRVLGVGPSLIYGAGVPEKDVWAAALERLLNKQQGRDGPWRVLNGGVNGYSTVQACRFATRLLPEVEPDLLLVFLGPGDVSLLDPSSARALRPWRGRLAPVDLVERWPEPLLPAVLSVHDFLWRWSSLYARHRLRAGADEHRPEAAERYVISRQPVEDPWMRDALARTFEELALCRDACAAAGVELRVVLTLHRSQYSAGRWTRYLLQDLAGIPPRGTPRTEPQEVLAEELGRLSIRAWSLAPEMSTFGNRTTWTLDDGSHWSAQGHARVAEGLVRCLEEEPELAPALRARRAGSPRL